MKQQIINFASLRVLVVDDVALARRLLFTMLRQMGIENVTVVTNGTDALRQLDNKPFDILLCDWNMPGMSGLEVLVKVREQPRLNRLPVLMVTAEISSAQVKDAMLAGVTSYVAKPFTPAILRDHITDCLTESGCRDASCV